MAATRPRDTQLNKLGAALSFMTNYLILDNTYISVQIPNFLVTGGGKPSYISNVGLGIRHRFQKIPWPHTMFDIYALLGFPNKNISLSTGSILVVPVEAATLSFEVWADFVFADQKLPDVFLAFRAGVTYPLLDWCQGHIHVYRSSGYRTPYYPVSTTDPTNVFTYNLFAQLGLDLSINEHIVGHVDTTLGLGKPVSKANLKNILISVDYLL